MAQQKSIFDEFSKGVSDAIKDISEKYQESVFGRSGTGDGGHEPAPQEPGAGFGSHTRHVVGWPEKEPEQPKGLSGEIFPPKGPEPQAGSNAPRLEKGWVIDQPNDKGPLSESRDVSIFGSTSHAKDAGPGHGEPPLWSQDQQKADSHQDRAERKGPDLDIER